jgi:hypothetical protein
LAKMFLFIRLATEIKVTRILHSRMDFTKKF